MFKVVTSRKAMEHMEKEHAWEFVAERMARQGPRYGMLLTREEITALTALVADALKATDIDGRMRASLKVVLDDLDGAIPYKVKVKK